MSSEREWSIAGAAGEPILGNAHLPAGVPRGVIIIAHGFKGYKDYGFLPLLADALRDAGFIAHRFNFSHSGMTDRTERFERPDLFERDTWNKQVFDLTSILQAIAGGVLDGRNLPVQLFGHSRGGVASLLTAGRSAQDGLPVKLVRVITAASPDRCMSFTEAEQREILEHGWLDSPSSRTGQLLRVGRTFIDEQRAEPALHDLLPLVSGIECPVLAIHGDVDATVPAEAAEHIANAAKQGKAVRIVGGDHVFNTPNPASRDDTRSRQLNDLIAAILRDL